MNAPPRTAKKIMENSNSGFLTWEGGWISPATRFPDDGPAWLRRLEIIYAVRSLKNTDDVTAHCGLYPDDKRGLLRERCTCRWHEQTGKRCRHLWALLYYLRIGPVSEYNEGMMTWSSALESLRIEDSGPVEEYEVREAEIAELFHIEQDHIGNWDFIENPEKGLKLGKKTKYEGVSRRGRPPNMKSLRKEGKQVHAALPDFLNPPGQSGDIAPPGTENPRVACWLIALTVALAFSGRLAEVIQELIPTLTSTQLEKLPWLLPLQRRFELLRQPPKAILKIEDLHRLVCASLKLQTEQHEDPSMVWRQMLDALGVAGVDSVPSMFQLHYQQTYVCTGCKTQAVYPIVSPSVMLQIQPDCSALDLTKNAFVSSVHLLRCKECDLVTNDPTPENTVLINTPPILWVEMQYDQHVHLAFHPGVAPSSAPRPEGLVLDEEVKFGATTAEPEVYQLVAALFRYGLDSTTGHNIAVVRKKGQFWRMDDKSSKKIGSVAEVLSDRMIHPTTLFYVPKPATPDTSDDGITQVPDPRPPRSTAGKPAAWTKLDPKRRLEPGGLPSNPKLGTNDPFYEAVSDDAKAAAEGLWSNFDNPSTSLELQRRFDSMRRNVNELEFSVPIPLMACFIQQPMEAETVAALRELVNELKDPLSRGSERSDRLLYSVFQHSFTGDCKGWYNDDLMQDITGCVMALKSRTPPGAIPVRWAYRYWGSNYFSTGLDMIPFTKRKGNIHELPLFRLLGVDAGWRQGNSVITASMTPYHWGVVLVNGPEKLVTFYDTFASPSPSRFEPVSTEGSVSH